jgi:radical SAM protein with 4Fe4S-binding SPASM domain
MAELRTKRIPLQLLRKPDGTIDFRPLYVVWEITLRCDQACRFCGSRAGRAREDELTTDECLDVVRQLADLGTREIAMHGGEAYLRPDWLTLVRACRERGIDCTMVTGGRGMTSDVAKAAADAGISAVSVSIDGLEEMHDGLRAVRGSHAGALAAMDNLRAAGVLVGCNTQLNRKNFRQLPEITELLTKQKPYGWQVQLMVPMGRAAEATDLWLEPYDLLEVIPLVAEARARADEFGIKLWPGNNVGYFGPYEHAMRDGRSRRGHSGGCGGGVLTLGIEANGDVKGCSAMATAGYVGGNVREKPLREIWDHAPELRLVRDFKVDQLWGYCHECYYAALCKGGCIWTASTLLGRRGNNPYCHHRALELLRAGKRERLVRVEEAPGELRDRGRFELVVEDAPAEWIARLPRHPSAQPRPEG